MLKGSRTEKQRAARFLRRTLGEGSRENPQQPYRRAEARAQNRYRPILEARPAVPSNFVQRVKPEPRRRLPVRPAEQNNEPEIIIIDDPPIGPVPAAVPLPQAPGNDQIEEEVIIINDLPNDFLIELRNIEEQRRALN